MLGQHFRLIFPELCFIRISFVSLKKCKKMYSFRCFKACRNIVKSSHRRCPFKKRTLGNLAKFTGKHLRVAGPTLTIKTPECSGAFIVNFEPTTSSKKETLVELFSCELC